MLAMTIYTVWFVLLVVALEWLTGTDTPAWIILAMAVTYVAILFYEAELIEKLKGGYRWVANKFSSAR